MQVKSLYFYTCAIGHMNNRHVIRPHNRQTRHYPFSFELKANIQFKHMHCIILCLLLLKLSELQLAIFLHNQSRHVHKQPVLYKITEKWRRSIHTDNINMLKWTKY